MASHDIVAQRDYLPKLQEVPFNDYDDEEETVKMVQLVKTQDPTVRDRVMQNFPTGLFERTWSKVAVKHWIVIA